VLAVSPIGESIGRSAANYVKDRPLADVPKITHLNIQEVYKSICINCRLRIGWFSDYNYSNMKLFLFSFFVLIGWVDTLFSQCFLTGADLSYTNEILKNGGVYFNENGEEVDPFEYFATKETKIVRLRVWHTPSNIIDHCGNGITSSSLEDVLDAAQKVKSEGMQLKLSIHYSDYFADPSKQRMPAAWQGLTQEVLLDSIEQYTLHILHAFNNQHVLPEIISIGNETTWGFIDESTSTNGFNWNEDAYKFNVALNVIDSFNAMNNTSIKKAIHLTESSAVWGANTFIENGVDNFDIIGISYYPFFSPNTSIVKVGEIISEIIASHEKEVMLFETGFAWTDSYSDNYNNFITNNGNVSSFPKTKQGQKDFLFELAETVEQNNGSGLIYWEPGWITSDLCDQWGQGSSYENVSLFDTENNQALKSFDFFAYCGTSNEMTEVLDINVKVFPNPIDSNEIIIKYAPSDASWSLIDINGNKIMHGEFQNKKINRIQITRTLNGNYFLHIFSKENETSIIRKIIIDVK